MSVPVDIFVKDTTSTLLPAPLVGVTVNVYQAGEYISGTVTDSEGKAAFLLDGDVDPGINYEVRFFRPGVFFAQGAKQIAVLEPLGVGESNIFDHAGVDGNAIPISGSELYCRCAGQFVDLRGLPVRNSLVRINSKAESGLQVPKVFAGMMVAQDALELRTDTNGRIEVDLPVGAELFLTFAGESDVQWCFTVPNLCGANIVDLVHPYPVNLDWDDEIVAPDDDSQEIDLIVGEEIIIPFNVMFSDFKTDRTDLGKWFRLINSDDAVVSMIPNLSGHSITLRALTTGIATIDCTQDTKILPRRLPFVSMNFVPLTVNVT